LVTFTKAVPCHPWINGTTENCRARDENGLYARRCIQGLVRYQTPYISVSDSTEKLPLSAADGPRHEAPEVPNSAVVGVHIRGVRQAATVPKKRRHFPQLYPE